MQEPKGEQKQGGLSWSTPAQSQIPLQKAPTPPKIPKNSPTPASNSAKYTGMIVLGIIVGVAIAWGWTALRSSKTTESTATPTTEEGSTTTNSTVAPAQGSDPSLTIMTPQSPGTSVSVEKAIVASPTWVVVYENNNGKLGNALGAGLFFPEKQSGTVELLRATMSGKSYLAVKQVDNGDRKFSLKDDQFLSEGGTVQWVTFEVK